MRTLILITALAGALPAWGQYLPPDGLRELLTYAPDAQPAIDPESLGPRVSQLVRVDEQWFRAAAAGREFSVDLMGEVHAATVEHVRRTGTSRASVRGALGSVPGGYFILSQVNDAISGWFLDPLSGDEYELRYAGPNLQWLYRVDPSMSLPCEGGLESPFDLDPAEHVLTYDGPGGGGSRGTFSCPEPGPAIDYMVVYTGLARAAAGGTSAIQARIDTLRQYANLAYENSQVDIRMRIVYCGEVNYDEVTTDWTGNPTFTNFRIHLERLTNDADGDMDDVWPIRYQYHIDGCMLLLADGSSGGLGWCCADAGDDADVSAVMFWNNSVSTFAHEYGHNQGCAHDPPNVDCTGCNSYSRGHFFTASDGILYGTVMSYTGSTIPNFSNPDVLHLGTATGITNQRDNARTMQNRRFIMEDINTITRFDIWVNRYDFGFEDGSYDSPYRHITDGVSEILGVCPSDLPTLWVETASYPETGLLPLVIDKPMTIVPCGGPVVIGTE